MAWPLLTERFDEALVYASSLHRDQVRKGTRVPYVSHLLAVTALVVEHGGDEDEAIAALLHDAVEDRGGLPVLEAIRQRFGERVGGIVDGCTDAHETPKPPWHDRKRAYLEHLREAGPSVRLVSCADKLHNARAILEDHRRIGESLWDRFNATRNDQLWYYRALANEFLARGPATLGKMLDDVVTALELEVA